MPIVVDSENVQLYNRLVSSGAIVLDENQALSQDIRPAKIGLLNLMPAPAMESTENQWLRYISNTVLQVEPVLLKFDDDIRERDGASRKEILKRYTSFSEGIINGLDALIVTGDNLELRKDSEKPEELPFNEITYGNSLKEVIDWARSNVYSTIYSCLASHFALNYLHGVKRTVRDNKYFGVFEHQIKKYTKNPIVDGMDDSIKAPHSRWGNVSSEDLEDCGVQVLAQNDNVGWLLASDENLNGGLDVYLQGHPEYDKYDLHTEFIRDWKDGQHIPQDYYDSNNPASMPLMTWANDARALHSNWIACIYKHFSGDFS